MPRPDPTGAKSRASAKLFAAICRRDMTDVSAPSSSSGVLTGLDVVTYDPDAIWGPRIAYAPVEDLLFGFAMVTLTLASWAAVNRRANTARRRGLDTDTRRSSTR